MVGRFDEVESFGKVGIHDDPPEGRFRGIGSDACKVLVKPYQQVAEHHHVVLRIHIGCGRIEIPELPDRRGAMRYHITPTRVGLFEGDAEREIRTADARKRFHQPLGADDARTQVAPILHLDEVADVSGHAGQFFRRHHSERYRQQVGCEFPIVVITVLGTVEPAVESVFDVFAQLGVIGFILRPAGQFGEFLHQSGEMIIVCRG